MLTKNINVQRSLVNGARGVVKGFDSAKGGHKKKEEFFRKDKQYGQHDVHRGGVASFQVD